MINLRKSKRPKDWPKRGWYWFLHHDRPLEWTDDIDERWDYVCEKKPYSELAIRQRWMRPAINVPERVVKARVAYDNAWDAYDNAWDAYVKAWDESGSEIFAAMRKELPGVPWNGRVLVMEANDGD